MSLESIRMNRFLFLLSLLALPAFAQINDFPDQKHLIRPLIATPGYNLEFLPKSGGTGVRWVPNVNVLAGFDMTLKDSVSFGTSFRTPLDAEIVRQQGTTSYQDFRLAFSGEAYLLQLNYQKYKGFYAENRAADNDPSLKLQNPDLGAQNISANFIYVLHPDRFSLKAILDNSVRQESSGGSWLLGAAGSLQNFGSEGQPIVPTQIQAAFGDDASLKSANFFDLSISGGYGYSYIWSKKWFLSGLFTAGLGAQLGHIENSAANNFHVYPSIKADAVLGFGYNGDEWIYSIEAVSDLNEFQSNSTTITTLLISGNMALGYRF